MRWAMLSRITYEEACSQRKYETFRSGHAAPARLPVDE
jgi:hypothetical protein